MSSTKPTATSSDHGTKEKFIFREMIPFVIYAAIPLAITIAIALFFGTTHQ